MHLAGLTVGPLQTQAAVTPSPRLRQAAVEFEANFLQELLKPMKEDPLFAGSDGSGGDDGEIGGSLGTIDSMGTQAMAEALANAGGLGIARQVLAKMAPLEAANAAAKAAHAAANPKSSGGPCGGCALPLTMGVGNKADVGPLGQRAPTGTEKPGTRLLPR
ncbi:MAG: hypothetical protein ACP5EP_01950 [Acidobacteriaceae bacterium]